jgi:acetyl-CoA decarbonylase/synthase complex subunit gamma
MSKQLSPIDVYKLLPRTNCQECSEENCMAFATKLVNREKTIQECPPLLQEDTNDAYTKLWALLKPPVKEITIGTDPQAIYIGGKDVLYRHELTYVNPTAIALDITDEMTADEIVQRIQSVEKFSYNYIGMNLTLDMIAIRATSNNPQRFAAAVKTYSEQSHLPVILCSLDPEIIENGLLTIGKSRPLIYAATADNWQEMADLALMYNCPLTVSAPNDLDLLKSLTQTLVEYGVEDLVLDPGTYAQNGLAQTVTNFTMLRKAAIRENDEVLGFPLLGVPLIAWLTHNDANEVSVWHETWLASMLITRFADILIMHSLDGWAQLPLTILRNNLYTDPRKPVAVEPGLRTYGNPTDQSPLFFTTNFALTYYTVAADIESGGIDCYLLVVDSEGNSVESSVAGRKLTADKVAEALNESNARDLVKHNTLVIPGRAARLSGEIQEVSGWSVIVGPRDSSGIPKFVKEDWAAKRASV